jgi:hypothetical protein
MSILCSYEWLNEADYMLLVLRRFLISVSICRRLEIETLNREIDR